MNKKVISLFCGLLITLSTFSQVDKIVGKWKTIDDKDGTTKSIVSIYKSTNGKYLGKVEKLLKKPETLCKECEGANKNKPILGMIIINGMIEKDGSLTGGTILDPNNGKIYHCSISIDSKSGKLNVRGSMDKMGIIGRSQTWIREK